MGICRCINKDIFMTDHDLKEECKIARRKKLFKKKAYTQLLKSKHEAHTQIELRNDLKALGLTISDLRGCL